jgi:hypothetical protein
MIRVCPKPDVWQRLYEQLLGYSETHWCRPRSPPVAPLLNFDWHGDEHLQKIWEETANANGCGELISEIPDTDFFCVEVLGPGGGPGPFDYMANWDFTAKKRPTPEELKRCFKSLASRWLEIVGEEIGRVTRPLKFTGAKARRLLVYADADVRPPWGDWGRLSSNPSTFTKFRAALNKAVAPHKIDHVDFTTDVKRKDWVDKNADIDGCVPEQ